MEEVILCMCLLQVDQKVLEEVWLLSFLKEDIVFPLQGQVNQVYQKQVQD